MASEFLEKFEEVGIAWRNENSITIVIKAELFENDKCLLIENRKTENPKAPHYIMWRERKAKTVTED